MSKFHTLLVLFINIYCFSQNTIDTTQTIKLNEVNINNNRYSKTSQQINQITKKEIQLQKSQNTADLLASTGSVTVQKSQQGGGSPVIRGFEANKILLLVDGIRLNNLIYRSGHLQNVITVDENMLAQIDVLFGPSSTVFGSDALGGAVNMKTKNPLFLYQNNNKLVTGSFMTRYNSTNNGQTQYVDLNFAGNKWSTLTTFAYNVYGDLRMGKQPKGNNAPFGERYTYVETIDNIDYLVSNKNPLLQIYSGYEQYNLMQKIVFQPNSKTQHALNFQYSNTTDVPRYDRLTDTTETGLKYAEWSYGPQKRILTAYNLNKSQLFWESDLNLTASYQNIEESRITRKFNNQNRTTQVEKVSVYALTADFKKTIREADFLYGAELYYDDLNSTANNYDIATGITIPAVTRYPNGQNHTFRSDVFATYTTNSNLNTIYNFGIRMGFASLKSTIKDQSFFKLPYNTIVQDNFTYSATTGIVHNIKNTQLIFNLATGYRVPNVDDLGKLFDSAPGILIVPNPDIEPEKTVTADITLVLGKKSKVQLDNTLYFTRLFDAIVTDNFTFNGQSTVIYEGVPSDVFAAQNIGNGSVFGFSTTLKATITKTLQGYGTLTYTKGTIEQEDENQPLDHIPPLFGKAGIKYVVNKMVLDCYVLYNGKKNIEDYYLNGEDNEQYAPPGGMPSWCTLNFKSEFTVNKTLSLFAGIENILDLQYRTFASGINASGRNVTFSAIIHF